MFRTVARADRASVTVLAGVVGLVATTLAVLGLPPAQAAGGGSPQGESQASTNLRFVTYNASAQVDPGPALDDVRRILATHPDIVTLQEMASGEKRRLIRERFLDCPNCTWDGYLPGPPVPGETPILYRADRFTLVDADSVQVTEATYVGSWGAGPSTIRAKYVNWVRLLDNRTGRMVNVLNNHTVPSVQGKSGEPNRRSPARLKIYRKHLAGVQDLVRTFVAESQGLVFVTGDLNVNYRRDRVLTPTMFPYHRFGEVGLKASYEPLGEPTIGTHVLRSGNDARLIDYVYFLPSAPLQPYDQQVLTGYHSDHRPLLVDFQVAGRP